MPTKYKLVPTHDNQYFLRMECHREDGVAYWYDITIVDTEGAAKQAIKSLERPVIEL